MPRNEEGEFELVLGNRQLLTILFLLVVLLGVFFTMGYIVGRNAGLEVSRRLGPAQAPMVVEPGGSGSPTTAQIQKPATQPETGAAASRTEPASEAASPAAPAATSAPTSQGKAEPTQPGVAASKTTPTTTPAQPSAALARPGEPRPGESYWQVAAVAETDARALAGKLESQGLPTKLAPVPGREGLIRVLVGPLTSEADVERVRARLQAAGFKPLLRRY